MTPLETTLPLFETVPNTEEWRTIESFPNYAVSNLGRIKRLISRTCAKAGTILKTPPSNGYPIVDLCKDGGKQTFLVHRLVADAFLVPIEGKPFVNHSNGVRTDGRAENLEYASQSENVLHAYRIGLSNASGENNGKAVLSWEKVLRIRVIAHIPNGPSSKAIGDMFGVSDATIRSIVRMQTWVAKNVPTRKIQKNRKKNKPMSFFSISIRNSKKRGIGNTTVALLEQKMAYYGSQCRYCGCDLDISNRSLDHAIPLSRGGTNWTANFIPCCRTCNSRKRGKTIWEYLKVLQEKRKAPMFSVADLGQQATRDAATIQ